MNSNLKVILLCMFIAIAASFSILLQASVVLGDSPYLTRAQELEKETVIWRIIALLSLLILGSQYLLFKIKNKIAKWLSMPATLFAIAFPITLGIARIY